ncbi:MAG: helix-turn-helix transcriptional regulator [Lysobacterales bacterium]
MELFGLTRAEARLAMQLANGATLDEAAEKLHISRNTVKSHLSSVFSKTGVTRQTKLIQLILRSVAPMG